MSATESSEPPYAPKTAAIGGQPTVGVDVPITSVFLFLFLCGAVANMTIFQLNRRRGHKFIMSAMMFGFCMARIVTMIMRIVWACFPDDVRIGIAAMIFVSAGVLILFLINLIFAQRILRAAHPHFGWKKTLTVIFDVLYFGILAMLAMVITATVQSFYTLNTNTHRIDRNLQMTASSYLLMISFLPIPMVILGIILPRKTRLEKFGTGRWRSKIAILLTTSVLLCLGASFRSGTTYKNPRARDDPAWYDAKWCFYFFNFLLEIIVVYLYIILRVDLRFHIPDGSKGPGDYVRETKPGKEASGMQEARRSSSITRVMSEEEVFDDEMPEDTRAEKDVERQIGSSQ
ncbi:hypothetical protein EDD37DRAFT_416198 [Exophiala viscosa]|uniref:uncharacterized protein n=1 Tax=Exophiala viscosa TaxID=2486360 RepID=UPI00219356B6|nr:hypothetical protein EDD37DRAFT_416198 [Exophiala viscosa]